MKSEGLKRLSYFAGALGVLAWITFIVIVIITQGTASKGGSLKDGSLIGWLIIVSTILISFLLPFGITKAIAWVIEGFKQDKSK